MVKNLPAVQVELHRHLDVSLRLSTLLELCKERGLEGQSTSLSGFKAKVVLSQPLSDLNSVLARFVLVQKVLDRPEVLERVAFEALEDCFVEGTRKVELRFSPGFVGELSNLSWELILDAFERGIKKGLTQYSEIKAGLICIATRDQGAAQVDRTIDFFLKNQKRFIGFDLAGNETGFPCRDFETSFKRLQSSRAKITVHAGEAAGPENIWEAISLLGAHRIGHGVTCVQDPRLMTYLRDHQICLEMCPTSNWLTKS
ncbi:MAG: adenosine deaminase, partial [Bdellovibrionota bacterium]